MALEVTTKDQLNLKDIVLPGSVVDSAKFFFNPEFLLSENDYQRIQKYLTEAIKSPEQNLSDAGRLAALMYWLTPQKAAVQSLPRKLNEDLVSKLTISISKGQIDNILFYGHLLKSICPGILLNNLPIDRIWDAFYNDFPGPGDALRHLRDRGLEMHSWPAENFLSQGFKVLMLFPEKFIDRDLDKELEECWGYIKKNILARQKIIQMSSDWAGLIFGMEMAAQARLLFPGHFQEIQLNNFCQKILRNTVADRIRSLRYGRSYIHLFEILLYSKILMATSIKVSDGRIIIAFPNMVKDSTLPEIRSF